MKNVTRIITILFLGALLGSCNNVLEPPVFNQGSQSLSAGNGLVRVQLGAIETARTIMPTTPTQFSKYTVAFTADGKAPVTATIESPATEVQQVLTTGTWNVAVTAFMQFTVTGGTEQEYAAASGSDTVVVTENVTTDVQVALTPLSITDGTAPKGIFSYKVTFPADGTGTLTVKDKLGSVVTGLNEKSLTSNTPVSLELDSGYYDLSISLTNGAGQKAGVFDRVHLYPGLESKAEYTFTDADFTESIYLGGTVTITNPPSGITSTTVKAYSDALCTDLKGTFTVSSGNWFGEVPVALRGQNVYLTVTVGNGSRTWTIPGSAQSITATAAGLADIALPGTFYTLSGTIREAGSGTELAGATVVLKQGAATVDTITTPANGSYSFTELGGSYTLEVSKSGYLPQTIPVILTANTTQNVNVEVIQVYGNVIPIDFGGASTKTVDLSGLETGKQVYLVTVNTNSTVVNAGNTGGVQGSYSEPSGSYITPFESLMDNGAIPPGHHPGAFAFNANPPPITPDMLQGPDLSRSASVVPYTVGVSTKNFWIESTNNNSDWVQKSARLLAQGTYSNIWVIEGWGAYTISSAAAQALADKFDLIYPLETKILGYEYGGGPGGDGGKDGDDRIQILVYDFYAGSGTQGNTAGFYWSKDFYPQASLGTQKTNLAEIFYISARYMTQEPDDIYSTLVHEFQHMINFNVKRVKHSVSSQSWYNEMLAMVAEDMISPLIGVPPTNWGHPTPSRIYGFLTSYQNEGVPIWNSSGNTLESYAYKYAFGAYLARNYGGAELVKNILANNSTNQASIVAALQQTTGNMSIDFNYAVEKFAEAFIFSDPASGRATFNQTVTKTISGTTYTFAGFDIWKGSGNSYYSGWRTGPAIYPLSNQPTMQPNSVYVQSSNDWRGGTLSSPVTLNKPADAGVKLFLMIR
ncbi:hypothetical protein FACS189450_08710 [Spirochaetia bacterium]|nr:hypothetical protein FACS189450_08710 [Spirochaetia bacterium]